MNDWKVWIIRAFYGIEKYELPKSRCEFIRKLLFAQAFCLLVPLFTMYLILLVTFDRNARKDPSTRIPPVIFAVASVLSISFGGQIWKNYFFENIYWAWPLFTLLTISLMIAAVALFVGILLSLEFLYNKWTLWRGKPTWPQEELYDDIESYRNAVSEYDQKMEVYNNRIKNSGWNMLKEWLLAKKQLVCPPVEYVSDNEA